MNEVIFGFTGVLIGALIPIFHIEFSKNKDSNRNAKYLAARIISTLEDYLHHCIDVVYDEGQEDHQGVTSPSVRIPSLIEFPQDIDWKSIDSKLMCDLLLLPSKAHKRNREIDFSWELANLPDNSEVINTRVKCYSEIGLEVIRLRDILCKKYGIELEKNKNWDAKNFLEEKRSKFSYLDDN